MIRVEPSAHLEARQYKTTLPDGYIFAHVKKAKLIMYMTEVGETQKPAEVLAG